MSKNWMNRLKTVCAALAFAGVTWHGMPSAQAADQVVNVYNWGNSIGKDTVANFEKATGIKVVYQEFDSNETLQAKLLSGTSGYDIVVPSDIFWARQLQAGIFQKIDKTKLPNYALLDPDIMKILAKDDPGNQYGIPWTWGTDGLGINVERVKAALGNDAPLTSWSLLFDPKYAQKLKGCGISVLDSKVSGLISPSSIRAAISTISPATISALRSAGRAISTPPASPPRAPRGHITSST
jgi:putrescine transport system substrate-binding protein